VTLLYDLHPAERGLVRKPGSPIWSFPGDYIGRLRLTLIAQHPVVAGSAR
jgi:hypothetical protein